MEVALLLAAVLAAFYFILLRPVLAQQRERRRDLSALEIGDEILTTGGFYAVVRDIQTREDGPMELTLELAPQVLFRATPDAILRIVAPAEAGDGDDEGDDDLTANDRADAP